MWFGKNDISGLGAWPKIRKADWGVTLRHISGGQRGIIVQNTARQKEQLELWEVVSPYEIRPKKDLQRSRSRRRARRRRALMYRCMAACILLLFAIGVWAVFGSIFHWIQGSKEEEQAAAPVASEPVFVTGKIEASVAAPDIQEDFLEINDYSRPGTELNTIKNIFVHYTANPGTSAKQNRSYFANLAETHERSASAHFVIGYEGEIIQCIPLDEQAYAVMTRNEDSVSIECCYTDEDGRFTQETYDSLVHMLAWLIDKYGLSPQDILRHYDCGGKLCPIYYVENEDAWDKLLYDVAAYRDTALNQIR